MSGGNTVLTLTHSTPFTGGIQYCVTINGRDVDGILLVPGPVPNPFCFTTASGLPAPTGLRVSGPGPNDVILTWNSVPGAASYVVYHSLNRLAAWPWSQLGTVTSPAYVHTGAWNDGTTHYYIVRAKDATNLQSGNSTMGVKLVFPINFNGVSTNIYWFSLPYRSKYHTAKDISDELTSIKIDVVAKWNPATQSSILWTFFRGSWRGANFAINPGDGLYIGVRSSFSWVVNGTDGSVSHGFTLYPPPNANLNWFSLPYTSPYTKASDLVTDIEGGTGPTAHVKIDIVARWNPATQSLQIYQWQTSGWTGTDFVLAPGDGIYFRITSSFNWTPRLITPEVP